MSERPVSIHIIFLFIERSCTGFGRLLGMVGSPSLTPPTHVLLHRWQQLTWLQHTPPYQAHIADRSTIKSDIGLGAYNSNVVVRFSAANMIFKKRSGSTSFSSTENSLTLVSNMSADCWRITVKCGTENLMNEDMFVFRFAISFRYFIPDHHYHIRESALFTHASLCFI